MPGTKPFKSETDQQPCLTISEPLSDPNKVIKDFFSWFDLNDIQELIWDLLKGALSSHHFDYSFERSNTIWFVERLAVFVQAVHQNHSHEPSNSEKEDATKIEAEEDQELQNIILKGLQIFNVSGDQLRTFFEKKNIDQIEHEVMLWLDEALEAADMPKTFPDKKMVLEFSTNLRRFIQLLHNANLHQIVQTSQ